MKHTIPSTITIAVIATLAPGFCFAQTSPSSSGSQLDRIAAHELDPTAPNQEITVVPQGSTQFALKGLSRTEGTTAGMTMVKPDAKDSKEMTDAPASSLFSDPNFYSDYQYEHVQDTLPSPLGLDGDKNSGTVGFDFVSLWQTIVGFNFTYTNGNLNGKTPAFASPGATGIPETFLTNSSNSYFFSSYAAKNFDDWINVGSSFTYGRTDTDFRTNTPSGTVTFPGFFGGPGFATPTAASYFDQPTREDSYAISPFVGVSHTWGAFSVASTPSYIWDYNHYEFAHPLPGVGAVTPLPTRTINSTFLWLNTFQYAVTDKIRLSTLANWTRHVSTGVLTAPGSVPISHGWMTFGAKADYSFNKDGDVYVQFEHDAFSDNTDDYRIRGGISYNF